MNAVTKIWRTFLRSFSDPPKSCERQAKGEDASAIESSHVFVGTYTTADAKRLLSRLTACGVHFEIIGDFRGPTESDDGSYVDQPRINIFVEKADAQKATDLISEASRPKPE